MNRELLEHPFDPAQIKQRKGRNGVLDYVEGHTVIARLNTALDGAWSFDTGSPPRSWPPSRRAPFLRGSAGTARTAGPEPVLGVGVSAHGTLLRKCRHDAVALTASASPPRLRCNPGDSDRRALEGRMPRGVATRDARAKSRFTLRPTDLREVPGNPPRSRVRRQKRPTRRAR
jgi:hypothetical protein